MLAEHELSKYDLTLLISNQVQSLVLWYNLLNILANLILDLLWNLLI